jgi:hypothetical protein
MQNSAASAPPQAAKAGFTVLLVDQDFWRGILNLGCDGQSRNIPEIRAYGG